MRHILLATAALSAAFLVGCKEEPKVMSTTQPTAAEKANEMGADMKDKAKEMGGDMKDKAKEMGGDMKDAAKDMKDKTKEAMDGMKLPPATMPSASMETAANPTEVQKLIDQAMQYIKDNKLDMAEQTVSKLDSMKSSMSPEWASKVDAVKQALGAAKASGGIKIPGL